MPWMKFRPQRQWGRYNTRIFREILNARNARKAKRSFIIPGIQVCDPLQPNFEAMVLGEHKEQQTSIKSTTPIQSQTDKDHPLYKDTEAWLFEGKIGFTDGVDQACALIKATPTKPLPDSLASHMPHDFLPSDFENQVIDSILAGERFDQTLEKLPKKFDPFLFWITQQIHWGTPVVKRSHIILSNLCRRIAYISAAREKNLLVDVRFDHNSPISTYFSGDQSGLGAPLVFRQMPFLAMQTEHVVRPIASKTEVEETRKINVPDLYPITTLIDLEKTNVYNDTVLMPRQILPSLNLNTIMFSRDTSTLMDQKYPWTIEQHSANAVCNCFCAAVAQALRESSPVFVDQENKILEKPFVVKAVQLVKGRLDMVLLQLNTLNLNTKKDAGDIKNLVWIEKGAPLYSAKPHYENVKEKDLKVNMDTVKKFVSLLLYS